MEMKPPVTSLSDEFRVVTRKKWIARRRMHHWPRGISDQDESTVDVDKFLKRVENLCARMSGSGYFLEAMSTLKQSLHELQERTLSELQRVVCFGLGPFTRNFQAFHQLAFILCVQRHCSITEAIFFDPVFSESEKQTLERLNCTVMQENCEGKCEADVITLFYLPHCPSSLTNNLLWRNWRPQNLQNLVVINNSFNSIINAMIGGILPEDTYIFNVLKVAKEFPLDDDYETRNIFNDLSVHIFPVKNMPADDTVFWEQKDAPNYVDEMISSVDFAKLSLA